MGTFKTEGPKYLRESGSFSIGGNDSDKYADNYGKIFGHEDPLPKDKEKKHKPRREPSPLIKIKR